MSNPAYKVEFEGKARIGEIFGNMVSFQLRPEDLTSPLAIQMAISRLYEELMKAMQGPPTKHYVAEVRFNDSTGTPVTIGVDLGQTLPPLSKKEVKVKVIIEFYDEEAESV
ncbi:MAG: hypothetical protein ACP5HQ_05675 [Thermoprotei archaeon]